MILAEWIKTKRTSTRLLIIVTPFIVPAMLIAYFSMITLGDKANIRMYSHFFELLLVFMPLIISLLSGLIIMKEEEAGNFTGYLMSPVIRAKLYLSKLSFTVLFIVYTVVVSTLLIILGNIIVLKINTLYINLFIKGVGYSIIGTLFLCGFHILISFAYGLGVSVALGGIGFLTTAILGATSLGDKVWIYVPWTWAIRMAKYAVINDVNISKMIREAMLVSLISFILLLMLSLVWFNRWEGRKTYE